MPMSESFRVSLSMLAKTLADIEKMKLPSPRICRDKKKDFVILFWCNKTKSQCHEKLIDESILMDILAINENLGKMYPEITLLKKEEKNFFKLVYSE